MIRSLFSLSRVSNLPTVWSNVICAALLVYAGLPFNAIVAISILVLLFSLSCFYCGGMVLNDICDEAYDRENQSFRPIPSGLISREHAIYFGGLLFFAAFIALALAPNSLGILAGVSLLGMICLYNLFHKQYSQSVFFMAGARGLVYIVTALALVGDIPMLVTLIALLQGLYVLLLTVVARCEKYLPQGSYSWPVIPWLLAAIPMIDGIFLAVFIHPLWLLFGLTLMLTTRFLHKFIRGD